MAELNLDIPPPVTEENKADYLAELEKYREAEEWIKKHSINYAKEEVRVLNNKTSNLFDAFMELVSRLILMIFTYVAILLILIFT
tara:strand:- start:31 stop:285 length:255 start_codon:yes stop_codon:yes gene_type:complete